MNLLTTANSKTQKGEKLEYITATLQLLPNFSSGIANVCPFATIDCIQSCNAFSGIAARMPKQALKIYNAKLARTKLVINHRSTAEELIELDIQELIKKYSEKIAIRLNCFSDLDWSEFIGKMIRKYPNVIFYDYTKGFQYLIKRPFGYHLTYSWSGHNEEECLKALEMGINVAVPFKTKLPSEFLGHLVIDGDQNDLRFLDPTPVIVGLKMKKSKPINRDKEQKDMIVSDKFFM